MTRTLFLQNIIACIWDFDKTLIPGYLQEPIFDHYKDDSQTSMWIKNAVREIADQIVIRSVNSKLETIPEKNACKR